MVLDQELVRSCKGGRIQSVNSVHLFYSSIFFLTLIYHLYLFFSFVSMQFCSFPFCDISFYSIPFSLIFTILYILLLVSFPQSEFRFQLIYLAPNCHHCSCAVEIVVRIYGSVMEPSKWSARNEIPTRYTWYFLFYFIQHS